MNRSLFPNTAPPFSPALFELNVHDLMSIFPNAYTAPPPRPFATLFVKIQLLIVSFANLIDVAEVKSVRKSIFPSRFLPFKSFSRSTELLSERQKIAPPSPSAVFPVNLEPLQDKCPMEAIAPPAYFA